MNIKEKMLTLGIVVLTIVLQFLKTDILKLSKPFRAIRFLVWCTTMVNGLYIEREKNI